MTVTYGTGAKGRATVLHARLVRSRGLCERCGSPAGLQCAHIISRRYSATRTDERNAWCLCSGCHFFVDTHADEKMALVDVTIGRDEYDRLKTKALGNERPWREADWKAEVARLNELAAA